MDSYNNSVVNIFKRNNCPRDIKIKRGVKQGCSLSSLLFNICIDIIFNFLKSYAEESAYETENVGKTSGQAYADDIVLITSSTEKVQSQIDGCQKFLDFSNIKLNRSKTKTNIEHRKFIMQHP
jgi:hypothetical protein